jgi:5-methylcytosine-specific restriction endonuclease McrA
MGSKAERTRAGATWTEAKYFQFIRSGLRMLWQKWPVKWQVLEEARRPSTIGDKRTKWEYQCKSCKQWFLGKDVQVDHIVPAGTLKTFEDLPLFVSKLLVEKDGLQVLCSACHNIKTKEERK